MTKLTRYLWAAAFAVGMSFVSYGVDYTLIPYSADMKASGTNQYNDERGFKHAIDGSGLKDVGGGLLGHTDQYQNSMWMTTSSSLSAAGAKFFCVDLGATYNFGRIKVWNFNQNGQQARGLKDVKVYVTDDPDAARSSVSDVQGWGSAVWEGQFTKATGNNDTGMDPIAIPYTTARLVAFVFTSSWGDDNFQGLSEVQFYRADLAGEPFLASVGVDLATDGLSFEAKAELHADSYASDIAALAYPAPDAEPVRIAFTGTTKPGATAVQTLTGLAPDQTYSVRFEAVNSVKTVTNDLKDAICIYSGVPALTNIADGQEKGCVPVEVTVSRANADPYPLTVNYTVSSSDAVEGVDYVKPEGSVAIPANETSAVIQVIPLVNPDKSEDVHVSVALASGAYLTARATAVSATIANAAIPADANVWVAGSTSDGLASTASNWSKGVPNAANPETLVILLSGNYSSHDMTWDGGVNGLATTVTSWTQDAIYTGTVTIDTTYPVATSSFKTLKVTGDMTVAGGTLTHPLSVNKDGDTTRYTIEQIRNAYTYRLDLEVGSFTLGAGASVNLVGKGMSRNKTTAKLSSLAPVHGGQYEDSPVDCYGNPKYPEDIGWAGNVVSDRTQKHAAGGGAFKLKSTGDVVINGEINVDGEVVFDSTGGAAGAAGSVLIEANSVSGMGRIHADGLYNQGKDSAYDGQNGAGGRIAILTTDPVDLTTLTVSASADVCGNNSKKAQAGTVYLKDASMDKGVLYVRNLINTTGTGAVWGRMTKVSGEGDWSFDQIVLSGYVNFNVPAGKTLAVPTFESVTCSDTTRSASLIVQGTFDFAKAAKYTLTGGWNFAPLTEFVIDGDVEVKGGANLGMPSMNTLTDSGSELPQYSKIDVKVKGDLTVDSDSYLKVLGGGFRKANQWVSQGILGHAAHGGRIMAAMNQNITCKSAYDSVFSPCLPGCSIPWPNGQAVANSGGVMMLTVTGDFTMNGTANANGSPESHDQGGNAGGGAGGSINITAGTFAGSGRLTADGGSYGWMSGPGGRIAVKLTKPGADFSGFTGLIRATGRSRGSHGGAQGSAGTVYLKTGNEADFAGTLRIACPKYDSNDNWNNKTSTTELVSLGYGGDDVADYKKVKVEVRDYGFAAVNTDVTVKSVTLATADAKLDLEGNTLTVDKFEYFANDAINNLAAGEYSFAQLSAIEGLNIVDTSAGQSGKIIVKERVLRGLKLILR